MDNLTPLDQPTKTPNDIDTPSLPVLTPEEKEKRIQTTKQETSNLARWLLLLARSIKLNLDILVMALLLFVFVVIGYTYARIQGMTAAEIKQELSEIFELIMLIITGLGVVLVKLGMDRGALSTSIGEKMDAFKTKVFRNPQDLDPWGRTIVGDRKPTEVRDTDARGK